VFRQPVTRGEKIVMLSASVRAIAATVLMLAAISAIPRPVSGADPIEPAADRAGWRPLFDGKTTDGWRNYRRETIHPGWKVVDGALTMTAPGSGDIVSDEVFDWFELSIDYRIAPGGNSGIMFHVTEDAPAPWMSGPEVQVLDNARGADPQRAGWLYGLYPPRTDPQTNAPLDATRPAGEWNTVVLRIAPDLCQISVNGVRYSSFKLGSDDWNAKVAASKFAAFPGFGRAGRGRICLQDHGDEVAYRNIRIRRIVPDQPAPDPVDGALDVGFEPAFAGIRWEGHEPVDAEGRPTTFRPVVLTHAGDRSNRVFVVEQHGTIYVVDPAADASTGRIGRVFADLRDRVTYDDRQNEEGLLGLAFHPRFADNGEFFVYYTSSRHPPHTSVVARLRVAEGAPQRWDEAFAEEVLVVPQPFWNHNGGTVVFGPDGMLYVALGDGGSANDPAGNGQNLTTVLASILRIDVDRRDHGLGYAIPPDNPFVDRPGVRGEIWAYGLRNPWRIAFDRGTGLLWAADVGQDMEEEIDIVERGGNYGWNLREGERAFGAGGVGPRDDLVEPVFTYDHSVGASIVGGLVYRGSLVPQLEGRYLYADYVSGKLFALDYDATNRRVRGNHAITSPRMPVLSFGEDEAGEAYFLIASADGGGVFRFVAGR
jgi:glucose/arabinose dehydrogenase